jgi:hypothetical protein
MPQSEATGNKGHATGQNTCRNNRCERGGMTVPLPCLRMRRCFSQLASDGTAHRLTGHTGALLSGRAGRHEIRR